MLWLEFMRQKIWVFLYEMKHLIQIKQFKFPQSFLMVGGFKFYYSIFHQQFHAGEKLRHCIEIDNKTFENFQSFLKYFRLDNQFNIILVDADKIAFNINPDKYFKSIPRQSSLTKR